MLGANSGPRPAGDGVRMQVLNILFTGSAMASPGCTAILISGQIWNSITRSFTSTGTRPMPSAVGPGDVFRLKPNGKLRRARNLSQIAAAFPTAESIRGATHRLRLIAQILTG